MAKETTVKEARAVFVTGRNSAYLVFGAEDAKRMGCDVNKITNAQFQARVREHLGLPPKARGSSESVQLRKELIEMQKAGLVDDKEMKAFVTKFKNKK